MTLNLTSIESKGPQWMSDYNVPRCVSCLQLQPLAPESSLSYSHLSHSISSHLDSSPESSEAGADIVLSRHGKCSVVVCQWVEKLLERSKHDVWYKHSQSKLKTTQSVSETFQNIHYIQHLYINDRAVTNYCVHYMHFSFINYLKIDWSSKLLIPSLNR